MTSASPNASRLVRLLTELSLGDAHVSHRHFADKLGRLLDLSDAFVLSDTLRGLQRLPFSHHPSGDSNTIKQHFFDSRRKMVESIARSFVADGGTLSLNLPQPDADMLTAQNTAFEPYARLYSLHQSEMETRSNKLRKDIRKAVAGLSARLTQLAALDQALSDTLSPQMRRFYAIIPVLLQQRFQHLRDSHREQIDPAVDKPDNWTAPGGWLDRFYNNMQSLLLAELELRLQPAIGLIEALDEEENKPS